MNNRKSNFILSLALTLLATGLLVASLKFPLWQMRMESPQYHDEEALHVEVYPGDMRGDLKEIELIDKYIGVKIPRALPQLKWLPIILLSGAALGLVAAFLPLSARRSSLMTVALGISLAMLVAAGLAQWQMYKIGHDRMHSPIARTKNFTTPIIGKVKIANFEVVSRLGLGSYLIGAAIALHISASRFARSGKSCPFLTLFGREKPPEEVIT